MLGACCSSPAQTSWHCKGVCVGGRGMAASGWETWDVGLGEGSPLEGKEPRIQSRAKTGKRGFVRQVTAVREHDCTASETGDSQTVLKL